MSRTIPKRAGVHVFLLACSVTIASGQRVNADAQHIADFQQRVAAYVKLRNEAAAGMPGQKPTDSPGKMNNQERELAQKIRSLRPSARKGDIFTPEITAEFLRLIRLAWRSSDAARMKRSLARSEPVSITLHTNDAYPSSIPLQSMPPTLLENLPLLPKELEYRVISHNLVLRDARANLIVDFIEHAIP
jgi:hypothetical protein